VGVGGFVKCKIPKVFPMKYHHTDDSDTSMYVLFVEDISFVDDRRLKVAKMGDCGVRSFLFGCHRHMRASTSLRLFSTSRKSASDPNFSSCSNSSNIAQPKWFQCLIVRLQLKSWTSPYCRFNAQRSHPTRQPQYTTCIFEQMHPKYRLQTLHERFSW
jgi:hypothetical protein